MPHLRKVEHACQDRNHFPWQLPPEYAATVSHRPEICLHKWVEPLDFQRSKPRHDCTRQRCPSFGDRSLVPTIIPKPQHALVSVLVLQNQPEIAGYERMKLMEYTGVHTGDEANSIGRTSEMKSGNYSIDKKATSEATPRKQPTHSQLQSAWRAFERYSEASPKK